jgi:hypothetical protein
LQELHEFQGHRKKICLFVLQSSDSLRIFLRVSVVDVAKVLTGSVEIRDHSERQVTPLEANFSSSVIFRISMLHATLFRLRTQPSWLWVLLVMGFVVAGAGRADASCGDYVLIGNRHAALLMEMKGHHAPSSALLLVEVFGATRKPSQPLPCHGPQCRQRKAPKGLPVSVVLSVEQSDAVLAEFADLSPVLQPSVQALNTTRLPNEVSGRGLYRPPRCA